MADRPLHAANWLLNARERGNRSTRLDARHPDGVAWSAGNRARPLVDGATYFAELHERLEATRAGDVVMFTDWQGNPDQRLTDDPDSTIVDVLGRALDRGVDVRALVWRSHLGLLGYHADEHRDLGRQLQERGADVVLDMRVRANGSHHQKMVVLRHRDDPARDIAYVGGLDLCHGRRDDSTHGGDPQAEPISKEYGERPPWHDVQVALQGPVVHDVETVFRERWEDGTPPTRSPLRRGRDAAARLDEERRPLPPQAPPPPALADDHTVQLLRTYPALGPGWAYDFAPDGERSVARGYSKAVGAARSLIYLEDQFLWGREMSDVLVGALRANPALRLVCVLPHFPDQDGWFARDPQIVGRLRAVRRLQLHFGERVAFYGLENHAGTPVYVHAKVCVIDDVWSSIGSDNFCRRSWTHDSELSAVVLDEEPTGGYGQWLRLRLAAEHLDRMEPDELAAVTRTHEPKLFDVMADCEDADAMFARFAESADALDTWHAGGRRGPRPPGRLRRLPTPTLPVARQLIAAPWYRYLHDPDGRPRRMRRRRTF
ncbi:phospholipase D-like domain-containing protein [Nocardioides sp. zg-DK7169]|uniref:phospholipase D family protein n=1 Tax=Nocardioides sp. zg-DK7169 TaxID=2736600 RepID=UPI0015554B97|nr:phospholipase D-like domain-containing protein [Nocardioides sp. zg-DK7169]NPC98307.1 phospholipase [Nocardioides sp. zg-DK7169]